MKPFRVINFIVRANKKYNSFNKSADINKAIKKKIKQVIAECCV